MEKNDKDSVVEGQGLDAEVEAISIPMLKRAVQEDPIFRGLFIWRRQIFAALIVVLCAVYVYRQFRLSQSESAAHGAELYGEVRKEFESFKSAEDKLAEARAAKAQLKEGEADKLKEAEQKIESSQNELKQVEARLAGKLTALSDQKFPYAQVAADYEALLAVKRGDSRKLEIKLEKIDPKKEAGSSDQKRFYSELGSVLVARAMLDQAEYYQKAREALKALAQDAKFVNVSAALTLAKLAVSDEEKKEVLVILEALQKNQPEQGNLLENEIDRLKS